MRNERLSDTGPDEGCNRRVKDKVIIITGANSPLGIGRATAHQFAPNGARANYHCDTTSHLLYAG